MKYFLLTVMLLFSVFAVAEGYDPILGIDTEQATAGTLLLYELSDQQAHRRRCKVTGEHAQNAETGTTYDRPKNDGMIAIGGGSSNLPIEVGWRG